MPHWAFISDDGYSEECFLRASPGKWDHDTRVRYRPTTQAERAAYVKGARDLQGNDLNRYVQAWVEKKIIGWDLTDHTGAAVPHTAANLARLKQEWFDRLFLIIFGDQTGDPDPAANGQPPAHYDEAADRKNLRPA